MGDYVVVWNGAHGGRDADLLTTAPLAQKVLASPPPPRPVVSAVDRVLAVLQGAEALTMREIARRAGLSLSTVNTSLGGLRGRLERTGERRRSVYRLVPS